MPILLLPPRITDDSVRLWRAAVHCNWQTLRLGEWKAPADLDPHEIAVYGGYFIALAKELGVSLLVPPVNWLARLPQDLTRREIRCTTLREARGFTDRAFYKPADDKCFLARVYENGSALPGASELPDDVPVIVSEVVEWGVEFRCFVLDGEIVAVSPYLRNGKRVETDDGDFPAAPEEFRSAERFASEVIASSRAYLPPGVAIYVGYINGEGWAVIEANQAWGAGIYGCDPLRVLPVLRRVCVASDSIVEDDKRWVAAC